MSFHGDTNKPRNGSTNPSVWQVVHTLTPVRCRVPDSSHRIAGSRKGASRGNLYTVSCPLCLRRPAKRACPALGQHICPTCCATKRLVEIHCPADCPHLASAQRHPAAIVRRQQELDLTTLIASMGRRLTEPQLQIFFLLASVIVRHRPDGPVTLADADVADAAGAMAGTLEAAGRGLIAEIAGSSPVSEGLRRQMDALLAEVGRGQEPATRAMPPRCCAASSVARGTRRRASATSETAIWRCCDGCCRLRRRTKPGPPRLRSSFRRPGHRFALNRGLHYHWGLSQES